MKHNSQETNSNNTSNLVTASLLDLVKKLKGQLESSHANLIALGEKAHNPEECCICEAIYSAKTTLALHKHLIQ